MTWRPCLISLCAAISCCGPVAGVWGEGLSVERDARSFTVKTARLSATFEDGVIVDLRNLKTGEVHADRALRDAAMPRGLGHLTGDAQEAAKLHAPWGGARTLNSNRPPEKRYTTVHYAHAGSAFEFEQTAGCRATWKGLTNGEKLFPEETLSIEVKSEADALLFKATATSPEGGVYGVQVPLANLHPGHQLYVPTFGGVLYDKEMLPGLLGLGGAPFWEAPIVAAEGEKGSLCLWIEDAEMHPNFFFCNWSGKSFSLAIEHLNLMPFEALKKTESVWWRVNVFDGGWVDAMTPYKEWYARLFEKEIKVRASVKWADKIRVIIDHSDHSRPETYRQVAAMFDPETVMFHEWNARAPTFDQELPDWTPSAGYPERVAARHKLGFRTMAYVNSYCVNYDCPVFKRDRIREFGLPRRVGSFWRYTTPPQTFDSVKAGQLMYLDPLSKGWRTYHTDMMLTWKKETATDANYEDTAGCCGDFGNGTVDGLSGAQGTVALFQELLARNPSVPMASEYGPDAIAFAVRWPLRYQQVWGSDKTREFWMRSQRPVSAYLYGPGQQPWIPTIRATSNFSRHVVVACSDALGGMAQLAAVGDNLLASRGALMHMRWRAQLFSSRQLRPIFRKERAPDDLACLYEDRDGRVYKYFTSANEQKLVGPDERPLYLRVTGQTAVKTELMLPGWPACADGEVIGLSPDVRYALMPGPPDRTEVCITSLPKDVRVSRYYETEAFIVLCLAPVGEAPPKSGQVALSTGVAVSRLIVNDRAADVPAWNNDEKRSESKSYEVELPAQFVFCKKAGERPALDKFFGDGRETGQYIQVDSGLARGGEYERRLNRTMRVPDRDEPLPFRFANQGGEAEIAYDYLVDVPSKDAALEVYSIDESRHGNGTIGRVYVNGRLVGEQEYGPKPNPDWKKDMPHSEQTVWPARKFRRWRVPVGQMAGAPVLVTIATDGKADDNADSRWWSRPRFVKDPEQKLRADDLEKPEDKK